MSIALCGRFGDVRGPRAVGQRLLCLARPAGELARADQPGTHRRHPADPRAEQRDLWRAPDPCSPEGTRSARGPVPDRAAHAPRRHPGPGRRATAHAARPSPGPIG
ncbi:transcriptional regulator [Azorhizobium caulinodans ORS 571]|uniref:Transcriptional regulator n=1 Tax=Azorhizobium caulinodans (strain ATCC 43989 / DSM 5975 / JCM 20966 / LMG 6465 / NBRC 14845 / NCIMB 13405 / ORS 571) TaxID=438753 RepID=A8IPB4_AZOC5|nr:transcriptional regulator [Azorhizobium caulinodans ORS 571]